jgi:chaperonin GroEL
MFTDIIRDYESREKLQEGINKLANTVKQTLGPKGRYVILDCS